MIRHLLLAIGLLAVIPAASAPATNTSPPPGPPPGLRPAQAAIVINTADSLSVRIGDYYARARHIPAANVVRIRFDPSSDVLPPEQFAPLKKLLDRRLGQQVQVLVLTWARPYRVGCMSITSAFAFGFDTRFCAAGCQRTQTNPYFNSSVSTPYSQLRLRPTMTLAAADWPSAKALIDRGIRSDGTHPTGSGYLVQTSDAQRNVRTAEYPLAQRVAVHEFSFRLVTAAAPVTPADVMFYFTGAANVPELERLHFLPGAVADHLTSFGGMLGDSSQMSSLRWLQAGATGSYGTVVEPCNFLSKFPSIPILLAHYLAGETLIEAYWKSVAMPGQGIFIGEPLAAPFRP